MTNQIAVTKPKIFANAIVTMVFHEKDAILMISLEYFAICGNTLRVNPYRCESELKKKNNSKLHMSIYQPSQE